MLLSLYLCTAQLVVLHTWSLDVFTYQVWMTRLEQDDWNLIPQSIFIAWSDWGIGCRGWTGSQALRCILPDLFLCYTNNVYAEITSTLNINQHVPAGINTVMLVSMYYISIRRHPGCLVPPLVSFFCLFLLFHFSKLCWSAKLQRVAEFMWSDVLYIWFHI